MINARMWMKKNDKNFLGHGRIELLEHIRETGSINAAAKAMKMSYKAAWDTIDTMNNLSDTPLVERVSGGKGGGGTHLTAKGEEIVRAFRLIEAKHKQFLDLFAHDFDNAEGTLTLLGRLAMKTSARNQLVGILTHIQKGAVNVEVELTLKGNDKIIAIITHEGFENLGLSLNSEAYAIIKASWVLLSSEKPSKISTRNILKGTVIAITQGAVNTEVSLELEGKNTITSIITNDSLDELQLTVGSTAYALFKASSVIIGV